MSLRFVTWDVEHGSAAYFRTPNNKRLVVDLGARRPAESGFSPLAHLWNQWGVRHLDLAVITHPHLDHIEDIRNLHHFSPGVLVRPGHLNESEVWGGNRNATLETKKIIQQYIEFDRRYCYPTDPYTNPALPANNGGVSFQFFCPTKSSTANVNNHSIVTVVSYQGVKILLPGDNEGLSWNELLLNQNFVRAIRGTHILVAPHHGRESGFHGPLFEFIEPKLTIISDGRVVDTSATSRYSAVTKGWDVHRRRGGQEKRYCVTTRKDGVIDTEITAGLNGRTTLKVSVN